MKWQCLRKSVLSWVIFLQTVIIILIVYLNYLTQTTIPSKYNTHPQYLLPRRNLTNRSIKPPAVYLKVKGGLGNQLFQYACSYAIARKNNWPLYLYVQPEILNSSSSSVRNYFNSNRRDFALDQFQIPIDEIIPTFPLSRVEWTRFRRGIYDYQILLGNYPRNKILTIEDYCQSENFFTPYKDEIISQFTQKIDTVPIKHWLDQITSAGENSVSIHVRRGDERRPTTFQFYKRAIARMSDLLRDKTGAINISYFVFSDDISLAKIGFNLTGILKMIPNYNLHWVSSSNGQTYNRINSLQDFYLMSRCKHNIIPHSTFGWWAAYLNPNPEKIVIAARVPFNVTGKANQFYQFYYTYIFYPYDWIVLGS